MCGICGVVQVGGARREVVAPATLDAMTDAMTHRGPNDRGTYSSLGVAVGVRRLSIIDVVGGHQPFFNEDGSVVAIQNGELYNHEEIRNSLRADGHSFASRCDTEILPHLYERDDVAFPVALHGKFGIAVWDERRRRLVLARDRLGVKPLYWAQRGDLVVFASELKALLASGLVEFELDLEAIDLYFQLGFVPGPRTPLLGVQKLLPGGTLAAGPTDVRTHAYWSYPEPSPESDGRSSADYVEELLDLLREAVRDRLMSDVPLGAMLSGGLDSSLIVALMAEASRGPVVTFSVGFREDQENELADARRVAEHFGCEHHELELSVLDSDLGIDELVWHLDEPVVDLSALGFDLLSRVAAQHVTVALAGQGADELFAGYTKHKAAAAMAPFVRLPLAARRALAAAPWPSRRVQRAFRALAAPTASDRLLALSGRLDSGTRDALYAGNLEHVGPENVVGTIAALTQNRGGDPLSETLYLDAKLALVDDMLLYFDRVSMAHSLEVRVPFLDHRLVEFAARVPPEMKIRGGTTKRILREAGSQLLPEGVLEKKKVGFFRPTLGLWMDAQLRGDAGERLYDDGAPHAEFLDHQAVKQLVAGYRRRPNEDSARLILAILMLDVWVSSFRGAVSQARAA